MRVSPLLLMTAVSALALASCGDESTEPEVPRPSTIVVTGPDSMMVGDAVALEATVLDQDGNTMSGQAIEWLSSAASVVAVDGPASVRAMAEGSARVTATAGDASGTIDIVVYAVPVPTTIVIDGPDSLMVNDTAMLHATVSDQYGETMIGEAVSWTSSEPSVLEVAASGSVSALADGSATITASAGDATAALGVTVHALPTPTTITVHGPDSLMVGDSATLSATVVDQYGDTMVVDGLAWSSSAPAILTVSATGTVEALAAGSVVVAAAAGDSIGERTIVAYPVPQLELESDTMVLAALGDTAVVRAELGGEAAPLILTSLAQTSWNAGMQVSVGIGGPHVIAMAAGESRYLVESTAGEPARPDTVLVIVAPNTPYVSRIEAPAVVGPDSPVILHGYGLAGLPSGSVVAGADAAVLAVLDSASITASLPIVPATECVGAAATLEITGADVFVANDVIQRQREDVIALSVGETRRLTSAEASCIMVDAADSAAYALAYFDARYAYWQPTEYPQQKTEQFSVSLTDLSGTAGTPAGAHHSSPPSRLQRASMPHEGARQQRSIGASAAEPGDEWLEQTTPFEVGDTLDIRNWLWMYTQHHAEERHDVVVVDVIDGYLTVGVPVDSMQGQSDEVLPFVLDLVRELDSRHLDWLNGLFGVPALANGQYMILLYPVDSRGTSGGQAMPGWMMLRTATQGLDESFGHRVYNTLVHEYGHSLKAAYNQHLWTEFGASPMGELWTSEGFPTFLAQRAEIELAGEPIDGNVQLGPEATALKGLAYGNEGYIELGYGAASGLAFDFTWRLAEASGLTWQAAFDSVAIGINNNRYGCVGGGDCETFDGLYDLMSRYMGPDWDPVDAVLTYTASQILDDRVASTLYRNPYYYDARTHTVRLGPQAEVSAYGGDTADVLPKPAGSTGWALLNGGGGAFRATTDAADMEWLLIRIR